MGRVHSKVIKTGTKFRCIAPMFLTEYNKRMNKEVHQTCWQKPSFRPQATCTGCKYLEIKED